jgi:hypothetical protein
MPTLFTFKDYDALISPFDESKDSDIFWKPEVGDEGLPSRKGFITDVVYYMRGMEAPTLFSVWGTLFALSTAIKREAWVKWFPDKLYSNFFTLLIGPAGIVKKGATINVIKSLLRSIDERIQNKNIAGMKRIELICDKLTPEAMLNAMVPENKEGDSFYFKDDMGRFLMGPNGKVIHYEKTSEVGIVIGEASVSLGKQKYSEHIIQLLLDIYDCHEVWEWKTIARGNQYLRRLHTTMLAGTTMTGFREAIPRAAAADGFLSRSIIVHQPFTDRCFSFPKPTVNGPTLDELQDRFAWAIENTLGEFELTKDALLFYDKWYNNFHKELRSDMLYSGVKSRLPQQVLKIAFLLRAQRYDKRDKQIHIYDIEDAIRLLRLTHRDTNSVLTQMTGDDFLRNQDIIENYIKDKKEVIRNKLLQNTRLKSTEVNLALMQLIQEGKVRAKDSEGNLQIYITPNGGEKYVWTGE